MAKVYNCYMGEAIHTLEPGRVFHFKPTGKLVCHDAKAVREAREAMTRSSYGKGGLSARIFVGLNVGTKAKYTVQDVVALLKRVRKEQSPNPNASILTQTGMFKDKSGRMIVENSVQIIVIDLDGLSEKDFTEQMMTIAEAFVEEFEQEEVLVEIQKRGVVLEIYGVKDDAEPDEDEEEEEEENDDDE